MRQAREVMVELAASGLTPEQLALVMELSATLGAEAAPQKSRKAVNQANYRDRKRQQTVTNGNAVTDVLPPPNDIYSNPPVLPLDCSNEQSLPISEPEAPKLKPEHVVEAWNDMAGRTGLPKAKMTPERRRGLNTLIRRYTIEDFTEAINATERSSFCRGENGRGWRANIDFMLRASNFTKLIEGTYDGCPV